MIGKLSNNNLFLIRHGQSIYNLENRFTGWKDVELTDLGIAQATEAGKILSKIKFDLCYTSNLKRAQNTLSLILEKMNQKPKIIKNEALNERDYGDLIGQNKLEAANKFGSKQVQIWRRSFDVPPPGGESLKMTAERTLPYYNDVIKPQVNTGKNIIISAHGNSIRAIVMEIFNLTSEQILKTEIGWCEPWIISFDDHGKLSNHQIIKRPSEPSKSHLFLD
ncbi:MAG: 2,3-bisphosphoglycerate-dependent phosphoglycerate mutase [Candidatus Marinimicrobia bacterium]|nr:2,3-bisphosphoglycerate-dependent phosphoglycerate mutase [Candidatus Neomarinimicrobiota bacterium]|tara:strand:+ start:3307 stop:3969 length:663 start_codon:yes stop_codon:yes gene_type:complete